MTVRVEPELYWREGAIRYTTDGSDPTPSSRVYREPVWLSAPATVKAAMLDDDGKFGPVSSLDVQVNDTTAPSLVSIDACAGSRRIVLHFSEPVNERYAEVGQYSVGGDSTVRGAKMTRDGCGIELQLVSPLEPGKTYVLEANPVADRAPERNSMELKKELTVRGPVYSLESFAAGSPAMEIRDVNGLPVKSGQPWTINCFVKMDKQPENRTLIAGFGRTSKASGGDGRYLAKFSGGEHFWSHHGDLASKAALEVGKWQMLTATFDGKTVRLFKDGVLVGENEGELADDENVVRIAPLDPWEKERRFEGEIRDFTIWNSALSEDALRSMREEAKLP